ncbi:hypothetical protein BC827DRAFT_1272577 [Russula dissimulans]|nr:hypothetical protein BC827DRAFT_1272577 [Russula dissimulans]
MACTSVVEVVELIPTPFRNVLADSLHALVALVIKRVNSRSTLSKWREHLAAGTFPPHLRGTPPKVQLVTEVAETEVARTCRSALEAAFKGFQQASLAASISAKKDEVAALDAELALPRIYDALRGLVAANTPAFFASHKLPTLSEDADRRQSVSGWEISPTAKLTQSHTLEDCVVYASRVISITESAQAFKASKITKKRNLAVAARTAAGDMDVDEPATHAASSTTALAPAIQSAVDKAVASALKKTAKSPKSEKARKGANKSKQDGGKKKVDDLMKAAKAKYDHEINKLREGHPQYVPLPYGLLRYRNSMLYEVRKRQKKRGDGRGKKDAKAPRGKAPVGARPRKGKGKRKSARE